MTILLPRRPPSASAGEGTAVEDTAMVSIIPSMPPPPSSSQSVPGPGPLLGGISSNSIPGEFQPRSHFTGRKVLFVVPRRPGIRGPFSFVCDQGVMAWCSSIFDAEITRARRRCDEAAVVVAGGGLSGGFPRVVLGRVDDPGLFALFHSFIHTGSFSGMASSSKALRMKKTKGQGEIMIPRCKGSSIYGRQSQKDTLSSLPSESTKEKQKNLTPTTNLHSPTNPMKTTTAPTNPASPPSTDQNPLSYTAIFTLWIFADHHDIPMLQNHLMDQLLAQICTSHTLPTAEEMTPVFLQGFPGISLLGGFLCALAIDLAHRHHHLHLHRRRSREVRPGGDRDKLAAAAVTAAAEKEEDAASRALARLEDVLYGGRGIPYSGAAIDPIEDSIAGIFRQAEHHLLLQPLQPLPHDAHAAGAGEEEEELRPRGDHLATTLRGGEEFHLPSGEFLQRARRCEWHVHAEGVSCRASR